MLQQSYTVSVNRLLWMLQWKFTFKIREENKQLTLRYLLANLKPLWLQYFLKSQLLKLSIEKKYMLDLIIDIDFTVSIF